MEKCRLLQRRDWPFGGDEGPDGDSPMHTAPMTAAALPHRQGRALAQHRPAAKAAQVWPEGEELGSRSTTRGPGLAGHAEDLLQGKGLRKIVLTCWENALLL